LRELELVRAMAIIAVVLIHGTSEAAAGQPAGGAMQLAFLAVNKLCAFAVPVFIFISGIVLFYGAPAVWDREAVTGFYRRRLRTVLAPYLLWTSFYYVFNQLLAHGRDMRIDPVYFAKLLVTGNASYHLYFLVVIVQLYAAFPLMSRMANRWGWFGRHLVWFGAAVQLVWYALVRQWPGFEFDYLCGFSYAAYFAFGGWLGLQYTERVERLRRLLPWTLTGAIALGAAYAGLFAAEQAGAAVPPPVFELAYAALGLFAAAALVPLARTLHAGGSAAGQAFARLGAASFGVYLVHPLLLSLWRTAVPLAPASWAYAAANTLGIALVLGGSWAVAEAYGFARKSRAQRLGVERGHSM
jgi:peptidoglycan/LPS O-acetylase OafA/YrhL